MKKKFYTSPLIEVTNLGALGRLMSELGPGSNPGHMAAPRPKIIPTGSPIE